MTSPTPEYHLGDAPVLTHSFTNTAGAAANPSTVVVKVRKPDETTVTHTTASTPAVTNPSTGTFQLILPVLTLAGDWFYRFEGTGDLISAEEERFVVRPSAFTIPSVPSASQWVTGASLLDEPRLSDANMPPSVTLDMCATAATDFLYKRSGRRFRLHDVVLRPNQIGCGCSIDCYGLAELDLPGPILDGSLLVIIDGVLLTDSSYRLWDGHLLVRTDGLLWPVCGHLSTLNGTDWAIYLTHGSGPDMDGILACRELSIHIALALCGKVSKIPARATSVSRQGVSINLARGRRTGIALVDDFLLSCNPHDLMGRPSVMSPDTIRLSRDVAGEIILDGGGA